MIDGTSTETSASKIIAQGQEDLGKVLQDNPDLIKTAAGTYGVDTTKAAITIQAGTKPVEPAPVRNIRPIQAGTRPVEPAPVPSVPPIKATTLPVK